MQVQIIALKQVDHVNSEKAILHSISHPMIVRLYDTGQDDTFLYMYMEYVNGGELFSYIREAGRFVSNCARFYAASVTLAFQYLHGASCIVHTQVDTRTDKTRFFAQR